jgi:predicted alpha/beta superfamily hydrolase
MSNRNLLTLELTTFSEDERPVYVAGNFCNWQPNNERFKMQKISSGKYQYTFAPDILQLEKVEYKYTRGKWDDAELDKWGNKSTNRLIVNKVGTYQDLVPHWRNNGKVAPVEKFLPIVEVVSENFEIPQLKTSRKIHILLPHDYYQNTSKHYPVLYMQDAQNLFGEGSQYGNWEIDKRLSLLAKQHKGEVIVVAIDHGNASRYFEYSPYSNSTQGKGLGMRYSTFIVRNLKPHIDSHYRTKPERAFTGIGGSSMGGLISIYAGFMYPETFGRLMVLSPSLWVSPKIYFDAVEFFNPLETKIFLYGGGNESTFMIPNIQKLKQTIENQGFSPEKLQIKFSIDPQGEHNEKRWGQEFPKAVEWLFN